jgi:hypothetical protein
MAEQDEIGRTYPGGDPTDGSTPGGERGGSGGGGGQQGTNLEAWSMAAQVAQQAAQQEYLRQQLAMQEHQFDHLSAYQKEQLAFQRAAFKWQKTMETAQLTGMYKGEPTWERTLQEAGLTGYYNGEATLAREQMQAQTGLGVMNIMAGLRGPRNAFQYLRVLNGMPNGLRDLLGAAGGQFDLPGVGGGDPNAGTQRMDINALWDDIQGGGMGGFQNSLGMPQGSGGVPAQGPSGPVYGGAPAGGGAGVTLGDATTPGAPGSGSRQGINELLARLGIQFPGGGGGDPRIQEALRLLGGDRMSAPPGGVQPTSPSPEPGQWNRDGGRDERPGRSGGDDDPRGGIRHPGGGLDHDEEERYYAEQRRRQQRRQGGNDSGGGANPSGDPLSVPMVGDLLGEGLPTPTWDSLLGGRLPQLPTSHQSPPGEQAPTSWWNYQPGQNGGATAYPPGVQAPANQGQWSTPMPASQSQQNQGVQGTDAFLPRPENWDAQNINRMGQYQRDLLLAAYEDQGWDPESAWQQYQKSLPKVGGPTHGTIRSSF